MAQMNKLQMATASFTKYVTGNKSSSQFVANSTLWPGEGGGESTSGGVQSRQAAADTKDTLECSFYMQYLPPPERRYTDLNTRE
jgi:hypothetical protein